MFGLGGDKQVISLDWDTRTLRVVQWQISKDHARVLKSVAAEHGDDVQVKDSDSLARSVSRVLSQERIRTQSVIVDIPRDQAVLNNMSLPAVHLNDLAGMVQLQIARELPFPLDDAVVDFAVTRRDATATTAEVLVAAVRCEALDFYKAVCQKANLKLERVGLRPYANMVAVNEMLGASSRGRVMFVDIGPSLTEIGILREGALVFSRAASVALVEERGTEPPAAGAAVNAESAVEIEIETPAGAKVAAGTSPQVDALMLEITRSAEAYRSSDPGAHFDQIVIGGSSGLEALVAERVSHRFAVRAALYDPSRILNAKRHRGQHMAGFAAAVGLGIGHATEGKLHFDFLHPKKPLGASARRRQQIPLAATVVGAVAVAALLSYLIGIRPVKAEIQSLQTEITELDKTLEDYKAAQRIVSQTRQWEKQQVVWPDALKLVAEQYPSSNQEAYLKDLDLYGDDGRITFNIAASSRQVLENFKSALGNLTRSGNRPPELKSEFKVTTGQIRPGKDPRYPTETQMTVQSTSVEEEETRGNRRGSRS